MFFNVFSEPFLARNIFTFTGIFGNIVSNSGFISNYKLINLISHTLIDNNIYYLFSEQDQPTRMSSPEHLVDRRTIMDTVNISGYIPSDNSHSRDTGSRYIN